VDDDAPVAVPAGRYDRPVGPLRRRLTIAAVAAAGALALALGAWYAWDTFTDPVQWEDVGFHVNDNRSVDVTFNVTKAASATVTCRVRALSQSFGEVGVSEVEVGAADTRTQRVTVHVVTSELAVTGTVDRCSAVP
jgi:hypothetical protein